MPYTVDHAIFTCIHRDYVVNKLFCYFIHYILYNSQCQAMWVAQLRVPEYNEPSVY